MALIRIDYMSEALMRIVSVNVILPIDKVAFPGKPVPEIEEFKTLYLLHGVFGSNMDWISNTAIQRWAEEKNLAVVMPSGENLFYLDQTARHARYGEFVGRELVEMTRRMFPLSHKREDTFIAGLSMGGYGALRNGLKYHETFGYISALSAALIMDGIENRTNDSDFILDRRDFAESFFGDLSRVKNSDKDPLWLMQQIPTKRIPRIYMVCGTEDDLCDVNRKYASLFRKAGAEITYEEYAGNHDWDFWNRHISHVLDWLPLETSAPGVTSGNVGI